LLRKKQSGTAFLPWYRFFTCRWPWKPGKRENKKSRENSLGLTQ